MIADLYSMAREINKIDRCACATCTWGKYHRHHQLSFEQRVQWLKETLLELEILRGANISVLWYGNNGLDRFVVEGAISSFERILGVMEQKPQTKECGLTFEKIYESI